MTEYLLRLCDGTRDWSSIVGTLAKRLRIDKTGMRGFERSCSETLEHLMRIGLVFMSARGSTIDGT